MMRYSLKIGIPVLIVAAICIATLYTSMQPKHVYEVQPMPDNKAYANVLAILPHTKHSHYLDSIDNGTLFLLMKTKNKLFYISSFKQIASFGDKNKTINANSAIYSSLYIGRYSKEKNAVEYRSLKQSNIKSLVFEHKSTKNISEQLLREKGIEFKVGINSGAFILRMGDGKTENLRVGSWPFAQKMINKVALVPDNKDKIKTSLIDKVKKKEK